MTASKAQIAVVEDDSALRELLVEELEAEDYKVFAFPSTEDYQAELPSVDVVVSDIRLPGSSGLSLLEHVRESGAPALILITAFATVDQAVDALKQEAADFLTKPLDVEHLLLSVQRVLEHRLLKQELTRFKSQQKDPRALSGKVPQCASCIIKLSGSAQPEVVYLLRANPARVKSWLRAQSMSLASGAISLFKQ